MRYDVAVIGGGPAGMMAAGRASELGARVVLLEKNRELGIKLLITGKGRCNITNNTHELKELIKMYGENGKFLYSSFNKYSVQDTIDFFNNRGVETKVERGNRVFPVSDSSKDVRSALLKYLKEGKVDIKLNAEVKKIVYINKKIDKILLSNGEEILADNYVVTTGGKSFPGTGSTGDAFRWLKKAGHKITELKPSLVPIKVNEKIVKELEGLSLKNVEISLYRENKKIDSRFGEAIFTSDGMSGPIILELSKVLSEQGCKDIKLKIDFKPALDFKQLDLRIQRDFSENSNKIFKNSLNYLLPKKLIPVIIKLSEIDDLKKVNSITKEERKKLLHLLKEFKLKVKGLEGFDKAIITSGGVALNEIDPKTMHSKLISNLYLAGELLDLDGPTGGYNLQVCWSTGYLVGENVTKNIID